jgi:hypothetical protein
VQFQFSAQSGLRHSASCAVPASRHRVVERWKLADNGQKLEVTYTVDDPDAFYQPWSATRQYTARIAKSFARVDPKYVPPGGSLRWPARPSSGRGETLPWHCPSASPGSACWAGRRGVRRDLAGHRAGIVIQLDNKEIGMDMLRSAMAAAPQ